MNRFREAATRVAGEAREALRLAPLEIAMGFVLAAKFSWTVEEGGSDAWESWAFFLVAFIPGWIVVFAATTLQRLGAVSAAARWAMSAAGLALSLGYHAHIVDLKQETELWRFGVLLAGMLIALTLLPLLARNTVAERRYLQWHFSFRLSERFAQVIFYCLVLFGGMAGAMGAIHGLFDLNFHEELYAHMFSLTTLALGPWLLAAGIPWLCEIKDLPLAQPQPDRMNRGLAYLIVPLGLVYLAILFSYYAKVLLTGELPKNLLSPLALGAGFIGLSGVFALEPFRAREDYPLLSGFQKWFSLAYLPLVPLAAWAIWIRIDEYGFTEFRYLRALLLAAFTLACLIQSWRVSRKQPVLPPLAAGLLSAALILSSFGPWGMASVTKRSQRARLLAALAEAGVAVPLDLSHTPTEKREVHPALYRRVTDGFRYLRDHHGEVALAEITTGSSKNGGRYGDYISPLPLIAGQGECDQRYFGLHREMNAGMFIPGRGTLYTFNVQGGPGMPVAGRQVTLEDNRVRISSEDGTLLAGADLSPALNEENFRLRCTQYTQQVLADEYGTWELSDEEGNAVGAIILQTMNFYQRRERRMSENPAADETEKESAADESDVWQVQHLNGHILFFEDA